MPEIRETSTIANKWKTVTPARAEQYKLGVQDPKKDWGKNTAEAESNYEAGIKNAITRKAFGKGVKKAGTEAWKIGAVTKGAERFGPGVAASGNKYEEGFAPYRDVIKNTTLPKRGPTGSDENFDRVKAMGKALHSKKISS